MEREKPAEREYATLELKVADQQSNRQTEGNDLLLEAAHKMCPMLFLAPQKKENERIC